MRAWVREVAFPVGCLWVFCIAVVFLVMVKLGGAA